MSSSKGFWIFLEVGAIGLFLLAVAFGYYLFPEGGIKAWSIFLALIGLHLAESPVGLKIGRAKNLSITRSLVKTWLFGFTWWLPLKMGVIDN
jgi:hypothetical protein